MSALLLELSSDRALCQPTPTQVPPGQSKSPPLQQAPRSPLSLKGDRGRVLSSDHRVAEGGLCLQPHCRPTSSAGPGVNASCKMDSSSRPSPTPQPSVPDTSVGLLGRDPPLFRHPGLAFPGQRTWVKGDGSSSGVSNRHPSGSSGKRGGPQTARFSFFLKGSTSLQNAVPEAGPAQGARKQTQAKRLGSSCTERGCLEAVLSPREPPRKEVGVLEAGSVWVVVLSLYFQKQTKKCPNLHISSSQDQKPGHSGLGRQR